MFVWHWNTALVFWTVGISATLIKFCPALCKFKKIKQFVHYYVCCDKCTDTSKNIMCVMINFSNLPCRVCTHLSASELGRMETTSLPQIPPELRGGIIRDEIIHNIMMFVAIMLVLKLCSAAWKFRFVEAIICTVTNTILAVGKVSAGAYCYCSYGTCWEHFILCYCLKYIFIALL